MIYLDCLHHHGVAILNMKNVNSALYVISGFVSSLLRSNITESVACWYLVVFLVSVSHLT